VDSGAIIKGLHLQDHADFFWTVPEVLKEIRDKRARHVLETLPYELRTRQPSGEAVQAGACAPRRTAAPPSSYPPLLAWALLTPLPRLASPLQ
jgi:RNA-binding protein NOB1